MLKSLFCYEELSVPGSTNIVAGEVIPHIDNLQSLCSHMEAAFNDGYQSVTIELLENGVKQVRIHHLSKVSHYISEWSHIYLFHWLQL